MVAEFKVLTSSEGSARPLPGLSKVCTLARKKESSYFAGFIMIRSSPDEADQNRGNCGIDTIRCDSDGHPAKFSLSKRLHQ